MMTATPTMWALFRAFLVFTVIKMWWAAGQEPDLANNPVLAATMLLSLKVPAKKGGSIGAYPFASSRSGIRRPSDQP